MLPFFLNIFRGKISSSGQAGSHLWNFLLASKWMLTSPSVKASKWISLLPADYISTCFTGRGVIEARNSSKFLVWMQTPAVPGPCQWSLGVHPPPTLFHHCPDITWAFPEPWCSQAPSGSGACPSSLVENPQKEGWTWLETSLICNQAMLFSCLVPLACWILMLQKTGRFKYLAIHVFYTASNFPHAISAEIVKAHQWFWNTAQLNEKKLHTRLYSRGKLLQSVSAGCLLCLHSTVASAMTEMCLD